MLVLSRKEHEAIRIGDKIVIVVERISGSSVRLSIQAPPEISVDREEVHLRKARERRKADQKTPLDLTPVAMVHN